MTTVIYKDGVFACDSQTTWMDRGMLGKDKIFRNGDVVFGSAGLGRVSNILRYMDIPELPAYAPNFDTKRWITRSLVPAIRKAITDELVGSITNSEFDSEAHLIIYVNGVVGYLTSNLSFVEDSRGVYAVGSGSPYALGAVLAGAGVSEAVKIAIDLDLYSGGEVQTLNVEEI